MGAYSTLMTGLGVTGAIGTTFTHGLGITPANLAARVVVHQAALTNTGWPQICTIGTNIITVAIPVAQTLTTFDLEVTQISTIIG